MNLIDEFLEIARRFRWFVCSALAIIAFSTGTSVSVSAPYAEILIDAESGAVLKARNPDKMRYPASLTKMMTLYLVFEALEDGRLSLSKQLSVSNRAAGMSPSKLGVKPGEQISVETAIYALVTKSANDAAVVVAEALASSEIEFAKAMTAKAKQMGMRRTTFRNASGLPNRGQKSTARDMATLARHLLYDFPRYYSYFSTSNYTFRDKVFKNHNNLLRTYEGADGVKTGYIRASGFNLVASAKRDGHRVIGVIIGGKSANRRDRQMAKLLNQGFAELAARDVANRRPVQPPALRRPVTVRTVVQRAPAPQTSPAAPAWAIQVGAYKSIDPARHAAQRAVQRLNNLTQHTRIHITPYNEGDDLIYRARLVGLTERHAKAACKTLKRRNMGCVTIPPA